MVHRDFHIGNILLDGGTPYISDMGLCGEVSNVDAAKLYGVMPYVAPEVLRGKPYTQAADIYWNWCNPCQIDNLKRNFKNWTSGNEKIDNFIQEMQLKIDFAFDIVFEWIPYNQFSDIKEINKGSFATVYLAIWKNGPLKYNKIYSKYIRISDYKVVLKCLDNSQNKINEFLIKV